MIGTLTDDPGSKVPDERLIVLPDRDAVQDDGDGAPTVMTVKALGTVIVADFIPIRLPIGALLVMVTV